jgi:hypothetical protein
MLLFARVECRGASTARIWREASPWLCCCDGEACWGSLGLLCVLLSVGGQSFVAPFFTLPLKDNVVFPPCLDVAVGRFGGHKRKYAAMLQQSSSRAGVKVSMLSLPSQRPVPLFGWLVFWVSVFAGWVSWGRIPARYENRHLESQGLRVQLSRQPRRRGERRVRSRVVAEVDRQTRRAEAGDGAASDEEVVQQPSWCTVQGGLCFPKVSDSL